MNGLLKPVRRPIIKQMMYVYSILNVMLFSAVASGEIVQVVFSGEITRIDEGTILDGNVEIGTGFTGSYCYDNTFQDTLPDNEWGSANLTLYPYHHGPLIEGNITGFEYVPEPVSLILLMFGGFVVVRRR